MRGSIVAGSLAAALAAVPAQAQDSPTALVHRFAAGFATLDPNVMAALFRPDATFFGSTEPDMLHGPEGARGYFTRAWLPGSRRQVTCEILGTRPVTADFAQLDAWCQVVSVTPDGTTRSGALRLSATAMREDAAWRFASLHASAPPPPRR